MTRPGSIHAVRWAVPLLILLTLACRPPASKPDEGATTAIEPTRVKLDFEGRPLRSIVADLADRSGLPISVDEGDGRSRPEVEAAPMSLVEPAPVLFWEAMDRLAGPSKLQYSAEGGPDGPKWMKLAPRVGLPGPVSIDGAFRSELLGVQHVRTLSLGRPAPPYLPGRPVPGRRGDDGHDFGPTLESFRVQVEIRPEPRPGLMLVSAGAIQVLEAIDDRGRSLALVEGGNPASRSMIIASRSGVLRADLALAMPDPPGDSIARLKVACPLVYNLPRADAINAPLPGIPGRAFEGSGATLEILGVAPNPPGRRPGTAVEILFRSGDGKPPAPRALTFFDARDRELFGLQTAGTEAAGGLRLTYEFPVGVPARAHYASLARASVTVTFDFAGIPLP